MRTDLGNLQISAVARGAEEPQARPGQLILVARVGAALSEQEKEAWREHRFQVNGQAYMWLVFSR
jgi:hypothetical protein